MQKSFIPPKLLQGGIFMHHKDGNLPHLWTSVLSVHFFIQVIGRTLINFPLSLLVKSEGYKSQLGGQSVNCITPQPLAETNRYHPLYQLGLQYHPLAICPTAASCPFTEKIVRTVACQKITRNKFHILDRGILGRLDRTTMAELNCSISSTTLPRDIFLDKSQQYSFIMEFVLGTELQGE